MKKFARILALMLVLCLSAGALCACGSDAGTATTAKPNDNTTIPPTTAGDQPTTNPDADKPVPEKDTYHFTVVDEDGKPVAGAQVQLCLIENGEQTSCCMPVASDADGKVDYDKMPAYGTYAVHIVGLADGLELAEALTTTADVHEYTLTVKAVKAEPEA